MWFTCWHRAAALLSPLTGLFGSEIIIIIIIAIIIVIIIIIIIVTIIIIISYCKL
jgi:hypothetical protein